MKLSDAMTIYDSLYLSESAVKGAIVFEVTRHSSERLVLLRLFRIKVSDQVSLLLVQSEKRKY